MHSKSLLYYTKMILDEIIKKRRVKLKLSQVDLAEMSGISLATVKDIERGKANPSLRTVEKLLDVLGLELLCRLKQTV